MCVCVCVCVCARARVCVCDVALVYNFNSVCDKFMVESGVLPFADISA